MKHLRHKLVASIQLAVAAEALPLRTVMQRAGGAATLRALDTKKAAAKLKAAAQELIKERKAKGHSFKFDAREAANWVRRNCPAAKSTR